VILNAARRALAGGSGIKFRAVGVHLNLRDFAAQQLLLHVEPVLNRQQIRNSPPGNYVARGRS